MTNTGDRDLLLINSLTRWPLGNVVIILEYNLLNTYCGL